ncbi:ribosome small subunit-dependent GTPase A [Thiovibrio frasassiensis]|uniref:Small ribosomal subunit biogenesis GTPase RsgA n=1 Tax=Thiovibrio frasassiensis TaxID=2984131 RepID=A0A9X4MLT5_9BACT|nr:ribosome small subunit-dependent GTPase A [Thiovibrio frasassiensis]MDG4475172.1 ribosome small subunit-dependent GTPase A [Thiovibrio frasassiensis]
MNPSNLNGLGWDSRFAEQAGLHCPPTATVARVVTVDREQLLLLNETGPFRAKLSGKYLHESVSAAELPCVGDWVCVIKSEADQFGQVHGILERKTHLRRKAAGESVKYQMIAANIDFVIIVQSCHYDFNVQRLERYLVMVEDGGARPYILLSKTDLVDPAVLAAQLAEILQAGITAPVFTLSNVTKEGLRELKDVLSPGKTYCFVGSSGVGKSTIINGLVGQEVRETKGVSSTGEGRHTTVRRELIILKNGAMVIDNPGMREFAVLGAEGGIDESYADIVALSSQCRFSDCKHTNEPGCGVLKAVAAGEIDAKHYENFLKLRNEAEHYQMSYTEKRKKDKDFGKFIKSAKKDLEDD